ncbi:MAG: FAS1-like dehydratase domain-containing protein, partial [Phyllobacterium sp.]
AGVWMRKNYDFLQVEFARIQAEGGKPPMLGPSPGFRNLRWLKPVYAGDTIRFTRTLNGIRALQSRPGWSMMQMSSAAYNQNGEAVMTFDSAALVALPQ